MDKIDQRKRRIHSITSPLPSKKTVAMVGKVILNTTLISVFVWLQYWTINNLFIKDLKTSEIRCGIIDKVFERRTYNSKSGDQTGVDKIIVMKYSDGKVEKNVNDKTYYKAVVGNEMCFDEDILDNKNTMFFSILGMIAIIITYIVLIANNWDLVCKPFKYMWNKLPD